MGALILALTGAIVVGGITWVVLGSKIKLAKDELQNDILNVVIYLLSSFIVLFVIVVFVIGA